MTQRIVLAQRASATRADARRIARCMRSRAVIDYDMPSFATLRAVMARCECFIGNDGGRSTRPLRRQCAVAETFAAARVADIPVSAVWGEIAALLRRQQERAIRPTIGIHRAA